jgi:HlyD family secretion protein
VTLPRNRRRALVLAASIAPVLALFVWVAVRSGPLAPVPVTVATVQRAPIEPALHGIGIVEARETHRIGPTAPGRVLRVHVQVGDRVRAGQVLAELEAVDLDARLAAQTAGRGRSEDAVLAAEAQVSDAVARADYARTQAARYEALARDEVVSQETFDTKRREQLTAEAAVDSARAALSAARKEVRRAAADVEGTSRLLANLRLVSPVDGVVTAREADPGSTVVAGQALVEVVDPAALWVNVRFDQLGARGLRSGLPAKIALRSRAGEPLDGRTVRVEPHADPVSEELLAKVSFSTTLQPPPAIGELAEVTVSLPGEPAAPVVLNASVQRVDGALGVWTVDGGALQFAPVRTGAKDLDGRVQILDGLRGGERVVVYSQRALRPRSRIDVVDRLPGVSP